MLQEMVHPQDPQLSIQEEISSPIGSHLLEFSESELFSETVQNSEVGSSSNCSYEKRSSYLSNFTTTDIEPPSKTGTTVPIIFDEDRIDNDISAAIDFTTSPSFSHHQYIINNNNDANDQDAFDISSLNGSSSLQYGGGERWPPYEEECMSSLMRLKPPCSSLIDSIMVPYLPPPTLPFSSTQTSAAAAGPFLGMLPSQDLEFQGDNTAFFIPDNMKRVFNCSTDLQGLSNESQHLYHGGATATTTSALASEISSLEDPTFKVGKISVEERKRKIHRYMKKRNERNFSKKIKYACRKTLADSRPRVRGRFAKNDELGEVGRHMGNNNEDDVDEDVALYSNSISDHQTKVVVKEEDDLDSSDILAHISGVNSFKCNYPIQSWI